jgi:hypothetical protein
LALQRWLQNRGLPGQLKLYNLKGELIDFGTLLQCGNAFSRTYPIIADAFRHTNKRRNTLPSAHPYVKRGGGRTRPLMASEQRNFSRKLKMAFIEIANLIG